jgi:hypothetical protein
MGIVGIVWIVLLVLKAVGLIATGWLILIFWPFLLTLVIFLLTLIFGGTFLGIHALTKR